MKRKLLTLFIAILLVVTLCLTIVACGEKDDTPNNDQIEAPSGDNSDTDAPSGEQPGGDVVPPQEPEEELPSDEISPPQEPEDATYSLKFELKEDDTYEVIGHNGEPTNVVIPSTYQGKAVTSIGNVAFANCALLTSVTIGNNITSIGNYAFEQSFSLITVNVSSIEAWCGITFGDFFANPLYYANTLYLNGEEVTNLVIPDTVTEIKAYAFFGCTSLTSVTIPNSVTSIGYEAFSGCSSLDSVYYLGTIESWCGITFGDYANPLSNGAKLYLNGEEVTNLVIPDTVTEIKARAFDGYTSLTSVVIGNSVTSIGSSAFSSCDSLTSVVIPSSVTSIGDDAFDFCYKLVEVYNLSSLTIEKGNSSNGYVGYYALDVYTSLDTPSKLSTDSNGYVIHTNGAKKTLIGYTGSETELTLPNGITSINHYAFLDKNTIISVVIPGSVTSIGASAFASCESLSSVTIGNSVISILRYAFSGCHKLVEVYNLSSLTIEKGSYSNGYVGYYAWDVYTSLDTPSKLSTDSNGYIIYTNGEEKTLVGYVGSETELTLPSGITSINQRAFYDCVITSVTIPDSVTSIGEYAFYSCDTLTSVTIGNSVTSIGYEAFFGCSSLDSVNYLGTIESWCGITFGDEGSNPLYNGAKLYLNGEEVTNLVIPNTVTKIKDYAFRNCTSLTSVTIPNSVTSIGEYAFRNCTSLTSVTIGNSVESIGYDAFYWCNALKSINIPNSVTSIGKNAFMLCEITSVNISSMESWCEITFGDRGSNPLYHGAKLYLNGEEVTNLVIPNTVTEIKDYAFHACTSLTSVTIPNSVTSIGKDTFSYCISLINVTISNSVESIGEDAFYFCIKLVEVYNLSSLNITVGSEENGYVGHRAKNVYTATEGESKLSTDNNGYIIYTDGEEKILVGYTGSETELTLPSDITEIYHYTFYENKAITSVTMPNLIKSIGVCAFENCISLTNVTIGNSITNIGYCAFWNCKALTNVIIGNSITSIGQEAFWNCKSLSSVYYYRTEEEWNSITMGDYNTDLTDATRYYYSETEPTTSGNYWHYVDGVVTVW